MIARTWLVRVWVTTSAWALYLPPGLGAASLVILLLQAVVGRVRVSKFKHRNGSDPPYDASAPEHYPSMKAEGVLCLDGVSIFSFRFARLLCIFALFSLQLYVIALNGVSRAWAFQLLFDFYLVLLAVASLTLSTRARDTATWHLSLLLVADFLSYFYLDAWPYALLYGAPSGTSSGTVPGVRLGLLTLAAVIIPLAMPRPFRPDRPGAKPSPMETVPLFSRITYAFLDDLIFYAWRVPSVGIEDIPPVPEEEKAEALSRRAYPEIDPLAAPKNRHFFWGVTRFFAKDYIAMFSWLVFNSVLQFSGPVGVNSLLKYLETGISPYGLKPWVWIVVLSAGPAIVACGYTQYLYIASRIVVEAESVLTQIVFDHSMRIQLKSTAFDSKDEKQENSVKSSPPTPSAESDSDAPESSQVSTAGDTVVESEDRSEPSTEGGENKVKTEHLVGKINNLITSDQSGISETWNLLDFPAAVLQMVIATVFLYKLLGWSAFVAIAFLVATFPLPAFIGNLIIKVQKNKMGLTDQRVQAVTETLNVLRTIKLFAWEPHFLAKLSDKRDAELKQVRTGRFLNLAMSTLSSALPLFALLATIGTYALFGKGDLSPSRIFTSLMVFEMLQEQIARFMVTLPEVLNTKVSYDRYNDFLHKPELLPSLKKEKEIASNTSVVLPSPDTIGFNAVTFSWEPFEEVGKTLSPSRRHTFRLHFDEEMIFKRGGINLILGPTASGKTSVLMALLGEMHYQLQEDSSWFNLPREHGVAYAAQESWVLNETIRENILLGEPYSEDRYKMVLKQCGLERDLSLLEAGDLTEVGEKGLTLSGGQKARVTLARAIYSSADILLLDDVLAALDVHTAKWVVDYALGGELVKGRTVLLVTHNIALTAPIADHVVVLGKKGRVLETGTVADVLKRDAKLRAQAEKERAEVLAEAYEKEGKLDTDAEAEPKGKLIVPEEKAIGRVEWAALNLFLSGIGGPFVWVIIMAIKTSSVVLTLSASRFIGYWGSQYEIHPPSEIPVLWYLGVYALITLSGQIVEAIGEIVYVFRSLRASRVVHYLLLESIFSAPLRWLDVVPVGRIITRCTQDINTIDGPFTGMLKPFIEISLGLTGMFLASVYMVGLYAFLSGAIVLGLGGFLGIVYLRAQLGIRREMSNAKSSVMGQVATVLAGLPSIRAYSAQSRFRDELRRRIDVYTRAAISFYNVNRWISVRIDTLGGLFAAVIAVILVYGANIGAGGAGFTLSMILTFSRLILFWIRIYNMLELNANSLERILDFLRIEHEEAPTETGVPPAYWPASGSLQVEGLCARYSEDSPEILHSLSLEITSGERIGVVGRTGAGKSSIALALLRAIKTEGKVYYDGLATDSINLNALRTAITLIPQVPDLIRGTLRENVDPFGEHDDAELNQALRAAGFFDVQDEEDTSDRPEGSSGSAETLPEEVESQSPTSRGKIGLDTEVDSGGTNFSLGQRQIIALARAILRRSKLLILDEATAAIDHRTDTAIQNFLRKELSRDTTVITIAHRLQTIADCDKIMVLDAGNLREFDTPRALLLNEKGYFRALVDESDDREALLALIAGPGE